MSFITGVVYATSLGCRAATPETRAHVPYNILLVDCAEGFRMMAHGDEGLAIGDGSLPASNRSPESSRHSLRRIPDGIRHSGAVRRTEPGTGFWA